MTGLSAGSSRPPRSSSAARAPPHPLEHGHQPEPRGHGQERGDHQPAPGHRPDRPAGGGALLAHRPAQCHGRARDGRLAHLLPGYRAVADPAARAVVERHWGVPPGRIAPTPGRSALEIFEGLARGEVRAVWILCTNPAASMPDLDLVEKALRQAELVIVQDAYHPTETTRFADVLLPAAQWPEKDGVMTNSERCLTYLPSWWSRRARRCPMRSSSLASPRAGMEGGVRPCQRRRGLRRVRRAHRGHALRLLRRLACAPPRRGAAPVAVSDPAHGGTARLYTDGRFPTVDGRARLVPVEPVARRSRATRLPAHADHRARPRPLAHADAHGAGARARRAHAGALSRGAPAGRTPRGGARRRLRGGHLAPRQGGGAGARDRDHPRGDVFPSTGAGARLLQVANNLTLSTATRSRISPG